MLKQRFTPLSWLQKYKKQDNCVKKQFWRSLFSRHSKEQLTSPYPHKAVAPHNMTRASKAPTALCQIILPVSPKPLRRIWFAPPHHIQISAQGWLINPRSAASPAMLGLARAARRGQRLTGTGWALPTWHDADGAQGCARHTPLPAFASRARAGTAELERARNAAQPPRALGSAATGCSTDIG